MLSGRSVSSVLPVIMIIFITWLCISEYLTRFEVKELREQQLTHVPASEYARLKTRLDDASKALRELQDLNSKALLEMVNLTKGLLRDDATVASRLSSLEDQLAKSAAKDADAKIDTKTLEEIANLANISKSLIGEDLMVAARLAKIEELLEKNNAATPAFPCMPELIDVTDCERRTRKHSLGLVVPFRDRESHLDAFVAHFKNYLKDYNDIFWHIFVIDQAPGKSFNRAKLFNIGYNVSHLYFDYWCFHDVDTLPLEPIPYGYPHPNPMHLAKNVEKFGWGMPYGYFVGTVLCMNNEHMLKTNGWSNRFWGWGGEDDDMSARIGHAGLTVERPASGRYSSNSHGHERPDLVHHGENVRLLGHTKEDMVWDGLKTLEYTLLSQTHTANYSRYKVQV